VDSTGEPDSVYEILKRFLYKAKLLTKDSVYFHCSDAKGFWEKPPWYVLNQFSSLRLSNHLSIHGRNEYNQDPNDRYYTVVSWTYNKGLSVETYSGSGVLALETRPNFALSTKECQFFIARLLMDGLTSSNTL
jgi:hypothetical protein